MAGVALVLSLAAIALAAVAYWRSGGQHDVARAESAVRRELAELKARQAELLDHAGDALGDAYERSRARLRSARARIRRLEEAAVDGLDAQLRRATEHLEALAKRLEHAAASARDATFATAHATERGIARRARRVQARVMILEAKAKVRLAEHAARDRDFEKVHARLADATELLAEARETLAGDDVAGRELDAMRDGLRHAVDAVRAGAEDTRRRIDQVLGDADLVVSTLEADDGDATDGAATGQASRAS